MRIAERSVIVLFIPAEISWKDVWTAEGRFAVDAYKMSKGANVNRISHVRPYDTYLDFMELL